MLSESVKDKSVFIGNSVSPLTSVITGIDLRIKSQIKSAFVKYKPDVVYMYNFHPFLNLYVAELARKNGATFVQHVQEPYSVDKKVHKGLAQYWLYAFEYLQGRTLRKADVAVLSSKEASVLFDRRYKDFQGKKVMVPLMYEDLGTVDIGINKRIYITFVGPPVPAKGPETFLQIVDYCEKHNLDFRFILISRLPVTDEAYHINSNLEIVHKDNISDEEIGFYLQRSVAAITPYKTARQSSVALTSYMYGTPVISTNVGGLPEVIHHRKTGYLLDLTAGVEEWMSGLNFIKDNLSSMSKESRTYFIENFSEVNWQKYFDKILTTGRAE
jgi:glycosyltransferase involved in cell wall biosynthesis